jgi:hypothetical protein
MPPLYRPPKPGVLSIVAIVSLVWSGLNVLRLILWAALWLLLGIGSWLLGPAVGAVGTLFSVVVILLSVAQSILSIILFMAALATMRGEPAGRTLHLWWAWINLFLDGTALILTAGLLPSSWWGLAYAIAIIYVMGLPEVRAYFDLWQLPPAPQEGAIRHEPF